MHLAACHVHSNWSYDGKWALSALAGEFERRGYKILMITDHDRGFTDSRHRRHREACMEASSERLLVLPGIEYSDAANMVHVLVWGKLPFLGEGIPTLETLKAVKACNGVAVLAHPSRKGAWRLVENGWADYLLGVEIWNRKTDGWAPSSAAWRLAGGTSIIPFVGMDFHDRNQFFPLAMEIGTPDVPLEEDSVLEALRARRCCARAFGVPFSRRFYSGLMPALKAAESSRRCFAGIYKKIRNRTKSSVRI